MQVARWLQLSNVLCAAGGGTALAWASNNSIAPNDPLKVRGLALGVAALVLHPVALAHRVQVSTAVAGDGAAVFGWMAARLLDFHKRLAAFAAGIVVALSARRDGRKMLQGLALLTELADTLALWQEMLIQQAAVAVIHG